MYDSVNVLSVVAAILVPSLLLLYVAVPSSRPILQQKIGVLNRGGIVLYPLILLWLHIAFLGKFSHDFNIAVSWTAQAVGLLIVLLAINNMLDASNRGSILSQFGSWLGDLFTMSPVKPKPATGSRKLGTVTSGTIKFLVFGVTLLVYGSALARAMAQAAG